MTYDYLCKACNHAWEADQRIIDNALTVCPSCGKEAAERQIGGGAAGSGGFVLKGSGWGKDLYGHPPPPPAPKPKAPGSSE